MGRHTLKILGFCRHGTIASALVFSFASKVKAEGLENYRKSIFRIHVFSQEPDYQAPWRYRPGQNATGSGFFIGKDGILTNAHVVANARFIAVERDGDPRKYQADVTFIGHDCDLALVQVKDPAALKGLEPLSLSSVPKLHSSVVTVGYPMGGDQLSITAGIVSRISYSTYAHTGTKRHLLVQVDSAINPGNSGGPVIQRGRVVGVAFQAFTAAENTGYIIPVPVIKRFLEDTKDGHYDGHPTLPITTQEYVMLNDAAKNYYGSTDAQGVFVSQVMEKSKTEKFLKNGDVIFEIDGQNIGVDGRISFQGERIDFETIFDLKQVGEEVELKVLRNRKKITVNVPLESSHDVPSTQTLYVEHPKYYLIGGVIFSTLTRNYLQSWGRGWYTKAPLLLRYPYNYQDQFPELADNKEIVIVVGRLPHALNSYLRDRDNLIVHKANGHQVRSLKEFKEIVENPTEEFLRIDLLGESNPIVLPWKQALKINDFITKKYHVDPPEWLHGEEIDGTAKESASND